MGHAVPGIFLKIVTDRPVRGVPGDVRVGVSGMSTWGLWGLHGKPGDSQPQPPGLQLLLVSLQQLVALEVAGATQALHDLQEADLAETQARQRRRPGEAPLGHQGPFCRGVPRPPRCQARTTVPL